MFAGDKGIFPIYQQANHYQGLLEEAVTGNPDEHDAKTLHEQAWQLLEPQLTEVFENAKAHYLQKANRDADTCLSCYEMSCQQRLTAASRRFLSPKTSMSGVTMTTKNAVPMFTMTPQPGESDLLDIAGAANLDKQVHVASQQQLPEQHPVAAVYRF